MGLEPINWYNEPKYWPVILVVVNIWKTIGYNSILYYSTICGIDASLYEAAAVDGAKRWDRIVHITLSCLKSTIIILTLTNLGNIFRSDFGLFCQVPMNSGALMDVTNTIDTYVYRGLMQTNNIGMSSALIRAYGISIFVTVVGTICNLALTVFYAYPLCRKDLPHRNVFAFFLFFTMLFSGGLVPSYIMWTRTFHIQNTIFALLVPNLMMSAFNVIMMRTYFTANIPDAIIEAARIDGASEFRILVSVVLPMALPILATVGLMVGLGYWNDWMNGLYYLNNDKLYSVQVLLANIQRQMDAIKQTMGTGGNVSAAQLPSTSIRMAITVMGVLPVMVIYPFLQKYFVKGIAVGAVKE